MMEGDKVWLRRVEQRVHEPDRRHGARGEGRRAWQRCLAAPSWLVVVLAALQSVLGFCVAQYQVMLRWRYRQGWMTSMTFALSDDRALMPALGFVNMQFSAGAWLVIGMVMLQYERETGTTATRLLGVVMCMLGLLLAALVPISVGIVLALVGLWIVAARTWLSPSRTRLSTAAESDDASSTPGWAPPLLRSGALILVALPAMLLASAVALPGLQSASLRIVRRMGTPMPGSVADKVLMPELAAVMLQFAAASWAVAGWYVTHTEDVLQRPVSATAGAMLAAVCAACAVVLPMLPFWLGIVVGLLLVWRARPASSPPKPHQD